MIDIALQNLPEMAGSSTAIVARLGGRSIVLVGMMGVGKSSIGRRLGARLGVPFVDADSEIETAAGGMAIADIFARHGEAAFRTLEARVIARLLEGGPQVLATGGGAVMNDDTRATIKAKGVSIWLSADVDVLMRRISKRRHERPMLHTDDPAATLRQLLADRAPVYAQADLTVQSREVPHEAIVSEIITALSVFSRYRAARKSRPMTAAIPSETTTVAVALGARSYDIVIGRGVLASLGTRIAKLRPGAKVFIVTDENVARHVLSGAEAALHQASIATSRIVVPPGEGSKSYRTFEQVCEAIIASRMERGDLVVALGGGVIGDLAGFAAAVVRRGLDYIQVPTSLLAQVDSSVGGKTAIDSAHGKNLIGAFHQPILVLADTATLDTLPPREFRAGYAELAKYGLLGDAAFFAWLEANWRDVFAGGPAREHAIAVACRGKAGIVARDEREHGERALLNLGHTFGHALEAACGFSDRLLHGEAVAAGMALAFAFSARQGLLPVAEAERAVRHLTDVGLPTRVKDIPGTLPPVDHLMDLIAQDKKVKRGMLTFILVRGIGAAFVEADVDPGTVRAFLSEKLAER
jgi:shikimate kinase/3-dehydroquinate synthase